MATLEIKISKEWQIFMTNTKECEYCESEAVFYLGKFGNMDWFRCRDCGSEMSEEYYEEEQQKERQSNF